MVKLKGGNKVNTIMLAIVLLSVMVYVLGAFFDPATVVVDGVTTNTIEFFLPENTESIAFNIFKYVILGALAFAAIALASKIGGSAMSKKDYISLVIVAIAGIFLYVQILQPALGSATLGEFSEALKNALAP